MCVWGGGGGERGAAPCSTLPTADQNAVTESAVTTVRASLFRSSTLLTKNEFFHCSVLLSGTFKPQEFRKPFSGDGVVITAVLKGGRTYSSSTSVCWCQEVFWGHGWDVVLHAECQQKNWMSAEKLSRFMQNVSTKTHTLYDECQQKNAHATCRMSAVKHSRFMQNIITKTHTLHAECQQEKTHTKKNTFHA